MDFPPTTRTERRETQRSEHTKNLEIEVDTEAHAPLIHPLVVLVGESPHIIDTEDLEDILHTGADLHIRTIP